jgi:hypothetical protein
MPTETGYCEHCGQPLPPGFVRPVTPYGDRKPNKVGVGVTIAVHVLVLLLVIFRQDVRIKPGKVAETFVTFDQPAAPKPTDQAPKKREKVVKTQKPMVFIKPLPNTITVPPVKVEPEVVKEEKAPPQEVDMQAYIEARRKQRGVQQDQPVESENDKAVNRIKANIARANKAAQDDGGGGIFSITNQTFHGADVKFNGFSTNFKRRWLQQVHVERGSEPDVETAIVKKMIEIIRHEKTGDFEWDSHRLGRVVTLSARPQDTDALMAFLYKEMFPNYVPPRH